MTLKNRITADFRRRNPFSLQKSVEIYRIRVISGESPGLMM